MLEHGFSISAARRWLETLTITMLSPWFGFWANRSDPFLIHGDFPWLALVPLVVGLQHGVAPALASAGLLGARAYLQAVNQVEPISVTLHWIIGCLVVAAAAGFFRDRAVRRYDLLQVRAFDLLEQVQRARSVRHVFEHKPVEAEPATPAASEAPTTRTDSGNVTMIGFNRRGERRARRGERRSTERS